MEFDEFGFKEEIELMNIERQMKESQTFNNQSLGFNNDNLYNGIDNTNEL